MKRVIVSASFDDLRAHHMRFLQEASKHGPLHVLLWGDEMVRATSGADPKFPQAERKYFVEAIRYVDQVSLIDSTSDVRLPPEHTAEGDIWAVEEGDRNRSQLSFYEKHGLEQLVISEDALEGNPLPEDDSDNAPSSDSKKVIVTGCYDWFHSGHVRFFEEVSELGDLYVVVGSDANVKLLKGEGHPMYDEQQRRYMAGSIRFVKQALVSTGSGWLDAEPEIRQIQPDIYAVNEDGDKPEKREFCEANGIEYCVLKRKPKEGLPKRESTNLRGF